MKAIHNKVNIVPVIAKADTLTLKERERLKKRVSVGLARCFLLRMAESQVPGKGDRRKRVYGVEGSAGSVAVVFKEHLILTCDF